MTIVCICLLKLLKLNYNARKKQLKIFVVSRGVSHKQTR